MTLFWTVRQKNLAKCFIYYDYQKLTIIELLYLLIYF